MKVKAQALGVLSAAALFLPCLGFTQNCANKKLATQAAAANLRRDERAIQQLRVGLSAAELEGAAELSQEEKQKAILSTISVLMDGILSIPDAATANQTIAGYQLKNGLASIGTGQAEALIGRIEEAGGANRALIPAIRKLRTYTGKSETLEYLNFWAGLRRRSNPQQS
jgi:hypothetical protein